MSEAKLPYRVTITTEVTFDVVDEHCTWCEAVTPSPPEDVLIEHARHRISGVDYVHRKITLTTFRVGSDWIPPGWGFFAKGLGCPSCMERACAALRRG